MNKSFEKYVISQSPLDWTIIDDHVDKRLKGNNVLVINYVRFKLIMDLIQKYFSNGNNVLDLGIYPGVLPKIFYEFYPLSGNYTYNGVGLGFHRTFKNKMKEINVKLHAADLDPRLKLNLKIPQKIPLNKESVDFSILTDVIEHFFDPVYPLREINRVSKIGSYLILSTDNLNRFYSFINMLRGKSPNVPLLEGNLFYDGDWRPHFREYSKNELLQLLEWSGFEMLEHKFYSSDFGNYKILNNKLKKVSVKNSSLKSNIMHLISKASIKMFPYFKDNQILIARKKQNYQDVLKTQPYIAHSVQKWVELRKNYG